MNGRIGAGSRFAATIFLGAFLLFQVQPLIARYILPWFGGGPSVWTACMLFFQCLLVGGYAYAHWLSSVPLRKQVIVHLGLLLIALLLLPIVPGNRWKPDAADDPTLRIILLLICTVGLPYFVLSTTSPLLQSWFRLSHANDSPYRLYSLSNAGALLALVTYPVIVEPAFFLKTQAVIWSVGYVLFTFMFGYCALRMWNTAESLSTSVKVLPSTLKSSPECAESPPVMVKFLWAALPACGSIVLLAVTNQLCWDVSVVPFLWVLPLALYLLSFILCFQNSRWYFRPMFWPLLVAAIVGMISLVTAGADAPIWSQVLGFSVGAFVCFMVCHGETALLKPNPEHLTLYYLMLSIGGALGGIFVGVVAPRIFTDFTELHIGLWMCFILGLFALRTVSMPYRSLKYKSVARVMVVVEPLMAVILGLMLYEHGNRQHVGQVSACRNFYGVLRVSYGNTNVVSRTYRTLQSGRIQHGAQFVSGDLRRIPTTYYGDKSGVGVAIRSFPANSSLHVGTVGLGVGTIAAYARPGDHYCFYEINPMVIRLANKFFTYTTDCRAECDIVPGDARISMEREESRQFDLLAIDAFTSDAIPVHLLTREAFLLYLRHLADRGILAIHITNRYLDLEPVVQAIADDLHLSTAFINSGPSPWERKDQLNPSIWMLLARYRDLLDVEPIRSATKKPVRTVSRNRMVWTDDYNDLFKALGATGN